MKADSVSVIISHIDSSYAVHVYFKYNTGGFYRLGLVLDVYIIT